MAETIKALILREKELAEQARQATDAFKQQQQIITDYSSKIEELYKKINSGQLTLDEHVEANRQLREIQQELIDNFGNEASGIDLVTSSLEKQEDVLKRVNALKQSEYLKSEWENTVNKNTTADKTLNTIWTAANVVGLLNPLSTIFAASNFDEGIATDYREAFGLGSHLDEMNREYEQFSGKIEATSDDMFNHIIEGYDNVRKTTSGDFEIFGNVEDVKDTILHLQNDYKQFPGYTDAWADSLGNVWNKADDIVQKYGEAYHAQIQMNVASNEQYVAWQEELQSIYEDYEKATIAGDTNKADEAARRYKDLINKIRSEVHSSTYQDEIINVVPEIADVDYMNFENQIDGILNSPEFEQFKSLDIPITLSADTSQLYSNFKRIYDKYEDTLKKDYQIKSFESFINTLSDAINGVNTYGLNLIDFLKRRNEFVDVSKAYDINNSGGSFSGRYLDANDKQGTRFITNSDLENLALYKDEVIELKNLSLDNIDDITIAFSSLTSKYGESFVNLLSQVLTTDKKMDWEDWLNEPGFKQALAQLVIDANLEDWQVKEILTGLGLIESDTRREVTSQVENFLRESFGDVELSDNDFYWMNNLINGIMNSWDESDLNLLPFIWDYVDVPEGTVPSINDLINALIRYKNSLEELNDEPNPFSTISDSVKNYTTDIKPWIDDLGNAYNEIFNGDDGFDINVVDDDMLNNIRTQFEAIQEVFGENGYGDVFDPQALETFLGVLAKVSAEGDNSAEAMDKVQQAFNAYATSLFYSADGLKDLNSETANALKQMLEKSGVENYEEVVEDMENYQKALELVEKKTIDLTNATADSIQELITKGEVTEAVAQKIYLLAIQEQTANINQMNFDSSIDALYGLANQCGIAIKYVEALEAAMANIKAVDAQYAHQTGAAADAAREGAQRALWDAQKKLQEQVNLDLTNIDLEIKVPKAESGGGKDAGKEEADAYLEAFNAELENLDWLHENGKISIAVYYSNVV